MMWISSQGMPLKIAGMFGIWLILSGTDHLFHVGLGLVVSFGVAWLNSSHADSFARHFPVFRMLWYLPWLFGRIVQSGLHLTALILRPSLPIAPRLIHYRTNLRNQVAIALLGNSITLTPGTITAEVRAQDFVVHAIDDAAAHDLMTQRFEEKIGRVFQREPGSA